MEMLLLMRLVHDHSSHTVHALALHQCTRLTDGSALCVVQVHEGEIIKPIRRIIRVIETAMPNVIALLTVLVPITVLTAIMHAQMFGVFDAGYADLPVAVSRVVRMLFAPPPATISEG
jgi:hypothetical protein